ncbi:MAG: GNAT family N-acetyltransferase [Candidatus Aenigmatarchaeota archaeon]
MYKEIWKEPPWNENFWTDEMVNKDIEYALKQKDFIGKLAVNSDNVIGFIWGYSLPEDKFQFLKLKDSIYIDELAVEKSFRRGGIGTKLTNMLIKDAKKLGYKTVTLRTDVNGIAYSFYFNLGFEDLKIRDPQYQERTYMRKII